MAEFEIYFHDLNPEAQQELLKVAGLTSPSDMNYEVVPIAVVEFEDNEEDEEDTEPLSKDFILSVELLEDTSIDEVINETEKLSSVQDVDILETYENNTVRIKVRTDSDEDFDHLCTTLENCLDVDIELIQEFENF